MTLGEGEETPANLIATAKATFEVAIRLTGELELGHISAELFKRGVHIETADGKTFLPPSPESGDQELKYGVYNLLILALGNSAISTNLALEQKFGKITQDQSGKFSEVRMMVYQVRNCFAHNPLRARWAIFEQHRGHYKISLLSGNIFQFDTTNLNGEQIHPAHIGGFEFWINVLHDCEMLVSPYVG